MPYSVIYKLKNLIASSFISKRPNRVSNFLQSTLTLRIYLAYAYRICDQNGTWYNNWTNYTECLQILVNSESDSWEPSQSQTIRRIVICIMFFCSIVSLALLLMTFFIFFYFKTLSSCRIRVHRNLVIALIIHSALLVILAWPHLFGVNPSVSKHEANVVSLNSNSTWFQDWHVNDYLCKAILTMKLYSTLASINWMFIEGLLLHSRITVSVFRKDAPFKMYYFIGWGLPLILVIIWATQMSIVMPSHCWTGYGDSVFIWIIVGPMIIALLINCIFLVNIIRVLLTKLKLTVNIELTQIRKAIKATAFLFPLLGISHLLFCINPDDDGQLEDAYMIINAFLQSSQGIFVAILYCFMDSEVQTVLRNTYQRNTRYSTGHGFPFGGWSRNTSNFRNRSYLSNSSGNFPGGSSPNAGSAGHSRLELQPKVDGSNGFHNPGNGMISNGSGHQIIGPSLSKPDPNHLHPPTPPKKGRSSSFKFRQPLTSNGSGGSARQAAPAKPRTCIVYSSSGQMVRFSQSPRVPNNSIKKSISKNADIAVH